MPELPEVEVIVRQLRQAGHILNNTIRQISFYRPQRWIGITVADVSGHLIGRHFTEITRRAKYIILTLDNHSQLIIHLRMTGKLLWSARCAAINSYTREIFHFEDGSSLQFNDSRTLGKLYFVRAGAVLPEIEKSGIEPLSTDFSKEKLHQLITACNLEIKDFLLNQTKIAGIGNIYASEICFRCGIHPKRRTRHLTDVEIDTLFKHVPDILQQSIDHNGTTVYDFRNAENKRGEFQKLLEVYGRRGKRCLRCGTPIVRIIQKQRSTYFCPQCQK